MLKEFIRIIAVLIIILFFSYFVYPTRYYYTTMLGTNELVKVDRMTGTAYMLDQQINEWTKKSK